jgi:hypothetical protein
MFPHLYVYPSQRNFQIFQPEKDIKHIKDILYSVYNLDYVNIGGIVDHHCLLSFHNVSHRLYQWSSGPGARQIGT